MPPGHRRVMELFPGCADYHLGPEDVQEVHLCLYFGATQSGEREYFLRAKAWRREGELRQLSEEATCTQTRACR